MKYAGLPAYVNFLVNYYTMIFQNILTFTAQLFKNRPTIAKKFETLLC